MLICSYSNSKVLASVTFRVARFEVSFSLGFMVALVRSNWYKKGIPISNKKHGINEGFTGMTTAIYCRVSTTGQNLAGQKREISKWLDGHGIKDAVWYTDKSTGTNTDRSGLQDLQADVFTGTVKTIVVWKLDRLSRKMVEGINILHGWLNAGVRVVSVTQQLDFAGVNGQMVATMLFGLAEMETEIRRERQQAGIAAAKEAGKYMGRKKGSRKLKRGPHRAKQLHDRGHTLREIARALDVSHVTVSRYLKTAEEQLAV